MSEYTYMCRIVNTLEMLGDALDAQPGDGPVVSETDETKVQAEIVPDTAPEMGYEMTTPGGDAVITIPPGTLQTNDKIVISVIQTTSIFPLTTAGGGGALIITSVVVSVTVIGRTFSGLPQPVTMNLAASTVSCCDFRLASSMCAMFVRGWMT